MSYATSDTLKRGPRSVDRLSVALARGCTDGRAVLEPFRLSDRGPRPFGNPVCSDGYDRWHIGIFDFLTGLWNQRRWCRTWGQVCCPLCFYKSCFAVRRLCKRGQCSFFEWNGLVARGFYRNVYIARSTLRGIRFCRPPRGRFLPRVSLFLAYDFLSMGPVTDSGLTSISWPVL